MKLVVVKIHAEGTNKRYMTIDLGNGHYACIRIPNYLYQYCKDGGVKTSQWLRYHGGK